MRSVVSLRAGVLFGVASVLSGAGAAVLGTCGPFTDVAADSFCPFVLEIFYLGITTGTTATTYDPTSNVSRLQMAAFLSRTVDRTLQRGSRRAALDQFWTTTGSALGITTMAGEGSLNIASDGADLWVAQNASGSVDRIRASDAKYLETWTGAADAYDVAVAMGRIWVTGSVSPGKLYRIDPALPAGSVTTVATNLGNDPRGVTFDGAKLWTANQAGSSVSIVTPGATIPFTVTTVTAGFSGPFAPVYDGANVWVTDFNAGTLLKLSSTGAVLQTVTVGVGPSRAVFDGNSVWVPNVTTNSVSVVRVSNGAVLATLTGNGLSKPTAAAFDGQRILVTNSNFNSEGVSLFKAADRTPIGFTGLPSGTSPGGTCSDSVNFWVLLTSMTRLVRF